MRRPALVAVVSLVLTACATTTEGTITSGSLPSLRTAAQSVSARAVVVRFLEAYEQAPADNGASLVVLGGSRTVQHWAAWLAVQFDQIQGEILGDHVLRGIGPMQPVLLETGQSALITEIAAEVSFRITNDQGAEQQVVRSLDGLMVLAHDEAEGWRIVDFTRDGVLLSDSVHVFEPGTGIREQGVTILVDSFILDANTWAMGVRVQNDGGRSIRVDPAIVGLFDIAFTKVDDIRAPPAALTEIEPGEDVEALISVPIPSGEEITGLRLVVGARVPGEDRPIFLALPVRPVLRMLEPDDEPSASPAGSA
jgi:hypothetical protein